MKTFIDLKGTDISDIIRLVKEYNGKFPNEFEFPSVVTVRLNNMTLTRFGFGSHAFEITFRANMHTKVMDIHYELVGYAMSMVKLTPPFDMRVRMGKDFFDRVEFLSMPKDITLYKWLTSPTKSDFNGSNAEFIVFMCHCAGIALGAFPFALNSTVKGDRIVYSTKPDFYKTAVDGMEALLHERYKEKQLEGWDCINITWEQFFKIMDIVDEDEFVDTFEHIGMNHVAIKTTDAPDDYIITYYDIDPDLEYMDVSFTMSNNIDSRSPVYRIKFWHETNTITGERKLCWDFADPTALTEDEYEHLMQGVEETDGWSTIDTCVKLFLYTNIFMLYYKDVATDIEEKECTAHSTAQSKHRHGRSTVRMFKQYTLKKNWKSQVKRKKAEIKCLAWGVRGHFRHYTSGKVVFVAPYVKGKERAKYQGKDYALLPNTKEVI